MIIEGDVRLTPFASVSWTVGGGDTPDCAKDAGVSSSEMKAANIERFSANLAQLRSGAILSSNDVPLLH
jgi:hypothetical protein